MPDDRLAPAQITRRSSERARRLAETVRLHHERHEAERFESLAAEGEARACYLEALEHVAEQVHRFHTLVHEAQAQRRADCKITIVREPPNEGR